MTLKKFLLIVVGCWVRSRRGVNQFLLGAQEVRYLCIIFIQQLISIQIRKIWIFAICEQKQQTIRLGQKISYS